MKACECFSISQACWNFVICFIILNSIYFNIYHFSAKGEEQGRNTENTDICQLFTPFPVLPWALYSCAWAEGEIEHAPPVREGHELLLCGRAVRCGRAVCSYCVGGPWGSCLILVQRSHLKLVGFKVSFPVFFLQFMIWLSDSCLEPVCSVTLSVALCPSTDHPNVVQGWRSLRGLKVLVGRVYHKLSISVFLQLPSMGIPERKRSSF